MSSTPDSWYRHTFTVFTPTYNRAHTLHRVYDSLRAQTFRDFEWLLVDNASTDGTDELVRSWIAAGEVPIRYLRNEVNIGRQASWKRAVGEAQGELFLEVRSADSFVPQALERFKHHWDSIPAAQRHRYSAVTALAEDEHGKLHGSRFPRDILDSDSLAIRYKWRVTGQKWGFQRTDVMREQAIPEIPGYVGSIPEQIVWRRIARTYKTRFVNEVLRTYWHDQPIGLSRPPRTWSNAPGRLLEAEIHLNEDLRWFPYDALGFYRDAVAYACSSFHVGRGLAEQAHRLGPLPRLLWLAALPVGSCFYALQRWLPELARKLPSP